MAFLLLCFMPICDILNMNKCKHLDYTTRRTSCNPQNPSNIRLYNTEERSQDRSSFMSFKPQSSQDRGTFMEFSTSQRDKMEAKMEVSVLELYYSTFGYVCERQKGIVCGIFAI